MRKVTKVFLIVATVCVLGGAALSAAVFAYADFNIYAFSTNGPREQKHFTASSSALTSISFAGVADNLTIQSGDVSSIEVDYWENNSNYYRLTENAPGQFRMQAETNWRHAFGFDFDARNYDVVITVPKSFAGTVQVSTVSGEVEIRDNIAALDTLSVNTVSGAIMSYTPGTAKSADFKSVSGNVFFELGSTDRLKAETVSGEIRGSLSDLLTGDYTVAASSLAGIIDVPIIHKSADKTVTFKTVSGDISLKPAQEPGILPQR
jgi:hypothetical protein